MRRPLRFQSNPSLHSCPLHTPLSQFRPFVVQTLRHSDPPSSLHPVCWGQTAQTEALHCTVVCYLRRCCSSLHVIDSKKKKKINRMEWYSIPRRLCGVALRSPDFFFFASVFGWGRGHIFVIGSNIHSDTGQEARIPDRYETTTGPPHATLFTNAHTLSETVYIYRYRY